MRASECRQRGLSLTELMVSVAISVAVLSSLVYVYVGSRAAYRGSESLARLQENGRFALEWISRDLRQAGYLGCNSRSGALAIRSTTPPLLLVGLNGFEQSVEQDMRRFDDRTAGDPLRNPTTINRVAGDVLLFSSLDLTARAYVDGQTDVGAKTIRLRDSTANFRRGDHLVISDCQRAILFTATDVLTNPPRLKHEEAANSPAAIDPPFTDSARSFVARIGGSSASFSGYFIGNNRASRPTLYRFNGSRTEDVAENIEDLDVLYGIDADGDDVVDAYQTADQVTASDFWGRVLSVRISVVAVSPDAVSPPGTPAQVLYFRDTDGDAVADAQSAPGDRRLRQVFSTTIALRNRLP